MTIVSFIWVIWILIQVLIGYNLVFPLVIYLVAALKKSCKRSPVKSESDYAVIVTAYEQVTHIPEVVNSILALNYKNFLVYVVADKCDITGLSFDDERVIILRPEQTLAGNTRSHFYAIRNFKRDHERLTIIDSDNLVHPEYLNELDHYFDIGFLAVQGVRKAKNLDTTYARLDGARDIYYHFYDGEMLFKAGSSATLAGSGMAFSTALYRECLEDHDVSGAGFDKVLQSAIVGLNRRIAFADKAIVYDEKTSRADQLVNQRARWINTWFKYFTYGFVLVGKGIKRDSWNQFLFGMVLLRPPLFIFLLLSLFCLTINLFVSPVLAALWIIGFLLFILGFYLALLKSDTDARIYKSLVGIPRFIFFQVISLLKAKGANKRSVATTHFYTVNPTLKSNEN